MENSIAANRAGAAQLFSSVETIAFEGKPLCMIIKRELDPEVTTFLTPPEFNLQVGYIVYPKGHTIPRHTHLPIERQVTGTSEVLLVKQGGCSLDVYNDAKELVATRELASGDLMIMVAGGHGFRMQEDTVLLEIKQGPYPGVAEKERF